MLNTDICLILPDINQIISADTIRANIIDKIGIQKNISILDLIIPIEERSPARIPFDHIDPSIEPTVAPTNICGTIDRTSSVLS